MKLLIVTHVKHKRLSMELFGYGPYVREMNIWTKFASQVLIVAPLTIGAPSRIDLPYADKRIKLKRIPAFSLVNPLEVVLAFVRIPYILIVLFGAMSQSDHIHLRCPGNIGFLGCLVQVFFPRKVKTAKYAGNWDPQSTQPLSYRLQKWILSNTFLTKNMTVLVYGDWPNRTDNIKPFFTATYGSVDRLDISVDNRGSASLRLIFAGTLSEGKRPLYALRLAHELSLKKKVVMDFYGEGPERVALEKYIVEHNLTSWVQLHGNVDKQMVQKAFQNSDYLLLPSRSEGWPKVVAEAMWWGCIPLVTPISCVPWMLDNGLRGILLDLDLESDTARIISLHGDMDAKSEMMERGITWSRQYTLEKFEQEIQKLLR